MIKTKLKGFISAFITLILGTLKFFDGDWRVPRTYRDLPADKSLIQSVPFIVLVNVSICILF